MWVFIMISIPSQQVASIVRFVQSMGSDVYVTELCDYRARNVNPNELSVHHVFFEEARSMTYPVT